MLLERISKTHTSVAGGHHQALPKWLSELAIRTDARLLIDSLSLVCRLACPVCKIGKIAARRKPLSFGLFPGIPGTENKGTERLFASGLLDQRRREGKEAITKPEEQNADG